MSKYIIDLNMSEPKYLQIYNHIKALINSKSITDGEKLPAIRQLASELNVNTVTVINCYKKLKSDGYAYQKMGSGTYAKRKEVGQNFKSEYTREIKSMINSKDNHIDFTGETTKDVYFPIEEFKEIINTVLNRDGASALTSLDSFGYAPLRDTINDVFWNNKLCFDNFLIVAGAQQGIDIAAKAILNINDNVIVEKPTYGGALSVFKWRRANIFELPLENGGLNINKLEEIIKKNKIRCMYVMSYFHNPTGISYSHENKIRILELAEKYDFYIIEDDYLSELIYERGFEHEPFKKLDSNDRVIYIKSFSKVFLPGIRLGYINCPDIFRENMQSTKINTDIATSTLMQRSLELYIKEGYFKGHIEKIRNEYKKRYMIIKSLLQELEEYIEFHDPKGGLSFYIKLKNSKIDSKELFYKLKKRNVYITPGIVFYRRDYEGYDAFRLTFSQVSEEDIRLGISIIKEELEGWLI